jgi:hypothetical protein
MKWEQREARRGSPAAKSARGARQQSGSGSARQQQYSMPEQLPAVANLGKTWSCGSAMMGGVCGQALFARIGKDKHGERQCCTKSSTLHPPSIHNPSLSLFPSHPCSAILSARPLRQPGRSPQRSALSPAHSPYSSLVLFGRSANPRRSSWVSFGRRRGRGGNEAAAKEGRERRTRAGDGESREKVQKGRA